MKVFFDYFFGLISIILLSPIFFIIIFFLFSSKQKGIFYKQLRVGKNGEEFFLYKFKTMVDSEGGLKITKSDDPRITKIGKILRVSKLDELPQLINILKGEMSFVGPRPEVKEYLCFYDKSFIKKVLSIKPGITDLSSIYFINESDILNQHKNTLEAYKNFIVPKKTILLKEYLEKKSFFFDMKIIFYTFKKLFFK